MASEYIKSITKDVKPAEAPPPLSPKERRKNWLYYHKWHLIIGALLLLIALDLLRGILHIGETLPDVQIACVTKSVLPEEVTAELAAQLSALAHDANGDGKGVVQVNTYPLPDETENNVDLVTLRTASAVQLMADFENRLSFLFLTDDPVLFESSFHMLSHPDGTLPETEEDSVLHPEDYVLRWEDCPALAALTAEGGAIASLEAATPEVLDYLKGCCIGRRGFWNEKTTEHPEACEALWDALRLQP